MRFSILSILRLGLCLLAFVASNGVGQARAAPPQQTLHVQRIETHRGPIWETSAVSVRYGRGLEGSERNRVIVVVRFRNISALPVPAMNIGGYRFSVMGQYPYSHETLDFNRVGFVRPNGEVLVTVSFKSISPEEQERVRSLEVREPVTTERLRNPVMWFFTLPPVSTLDPPRRRADAPAGFQGLERFAVRLDRTTHGPSGKVDLWVTARNVSSIPVLLRDDLFTGTLINSDSGNRQVFRVAPAVGEPGGPLGGIPRTLLPGAEIVLMFPHTNPLSDNSTDNLSFVISEKRASAEPGLQDFSATFPVPKASTAPPPPAPTPTPPPPPSGTPYVMGGPATIGPWQVRAKKVEVRAEGITVWLGLRNPNQTTQRFARRDITGVVSLADGSRTENLKAVIEVRADTEVHEVAANGEEDVTLFFPMRNPLLRQRVSTMNIAIVTKPLNIPVGLGQLYLPAAEPEPRPLTEFRRLNSNWSIRMDQVRPPFSNSDDTLVWVTVRNEWGANVSVRDPFEGVFSASDGDRKAILTGHDGMNDMDERENRSETATVLRPGEMASFTFLHRRTAPGPRASRLRIFPKSPLGISANEVVFELPTATSSDQGKTDAPSGQTTPPPVPAGDVRVIGPVALSRDWSLEI
ncbi:MAG: hypothetical protein EON90_12415, partial [Brevundimonas sp.]